jgi:hypothetical protein
MDEKEALVELWERGVQNANGSEKEFDRELVLDGQEIRFELRGTNVHLYKTDRLPDLITIDPDGEEVISCESEEEFLERVQSALDSGW